MGLLFRSGVQQTLFAIFAGVLLTVASALTATTTSLPLLQAGAFAIGVASGAYYAAAVPLMFACTSARSTLLIIGPLGSTH